MAKKLISILGKILLILSIVFVVIKVKKLGIDFSAIQDIPRLMVVFFEALILSILGTFLLAYIWSDWIKALSEKEVSRKKALSIYGKSVIGKYLPGNVMHYVERNIFAADYGLSQKKITLSTVMEIISQVLSALIVSAILLPSFMWNRIYKAIEDRLYILAIIGIAGTVLFIVLLIIAIKRFHDSGDLFGAKPGTFLKTFIKAVVLSTVYILSGGLGMLFIAINVIGQLPAGSARLILSSYSAAWVCGFVIPGAPGGIGVREAILTVLLQSRFGTSLMFIVIFHRLITIIGDFCVYVISRFLLPLADRGSENTKSHPEKKINED